MTGADPFRIVPVDELGPDGLERLANLTVRAFAHLPAWETVEEALEELDECRRLGPVLVAVAPGGTLLGWIGGRPAYPRAWELHPLAVDPPAQGRGVGRALVAALEERATEAGMVTMMLGTDDEVGGTTLFGRDLYPDIPGAIAGIEPTTGHPFAFYARLGYHVVGLIPDANGPGRPDILMAKRIG